MAIVQNPFQQWNDPLRGGRVIFSAKIYVGQPDTDPTIPANQLQVFYIDEDQQRINLAQPLTTDSGGYIVISDTDSTKVQAQTEEGNYSITVQNKQGVNQWVIPNAAEVGPVIQINHNDTLNRNDIGAHDEIYQRTYYYLQDALTDLDQDSAASLIGSTISTRANNPTTKDGGAEYILKTLEQAQNDGDVIDGELISGRLIGGNWRVGLRDIYLILKNKDATPQMYGALCDGSDDYQALKKLYANQQNIKINRDLRSSGAIDGISNQKTQSPNNSKIVFASDIDGLKYTNKKGVRITGLVIGCESPSTTNGNGILFSGCEDCFVYFCEIYGVSNNGVLATAGCRNIAVRNSKFRDFLGDIQDSSDIAFYINAQNCRAIDNECHGGNWHGVRCQLDSINHVVSGNDVSAHKAYGILAGYEDVDKVSTTIVVGNNVYDITGEVLIDGDKRAGAGVYSQSVYGIKVIGNTISNCNIETVTEVLIPAAIGVSGNCVVSNNVINDTKWYGIGIFSEDDKSIVSNNTITDSSRAAIYVKNSINTTVTDNTISFTTTPGRAIFARNQTSTSTGLCISGNVIFNASEAIAVYNYERFSVSSNTVSSATGLSLFLQGVKFGTVTGNNLRSDTAPIRLTNAENVTGTGNSLRTNSTYSIIANGTLSSVNFYNNDHVPYVCTLQDGATVKLKHSAQPSSGDWSSGSIVEVPPVAGGYLGYVCVAQGNPGTWKGYGEIQA